MDMASFLWRGLMTVLSLIFIGFAALQYNDPDPAVWVPIYIAGAIWTGAAGLAPRSLNGRVTGWLLLVSIVLAAGGVVYFWPHAAGWWQRDVWWYDELSREGIGAMMVAVGILMVAAQRALSRSV